ncbi:histidine triad nucleotide-binding protein [Chondromyces apiculatus]|uniref:Bis(5'-nucleosyl)-tetraphosphatase n=1 Tax=Chondromyces apiculatus DSM 436 TaxID=1192034 RepID=A0A017TC15_9BACT|nr:histidine triad nucleotide-binding protein [Chondromyces apiculatus]EYF06355.1 Bis(5'-nucleosyl)-tetraphosphatase [Chondromyces apiculatus DSM 436]
MCIFCKIANKEIPTKVVLEDDDWLAFHDTNPQAPTHVLVIPKRHVAGLREATPEDQALLGKVLLGAQQVAQKLGIGDSGFRTVINSGANAGQTVFHLHVHVLGGRAMGWPPG